MSQDDSQTPIIELVMPARADRLRLMRNVVRDAAEMSGCTPDCIEDIVIAVNEACANIIQHGYHRDPNGKIILEIRRRGEDLLFRLIDFAERVDPATVRPRPLGELRPGGLGTHFIRSVMDEAEFLPPPDGASNLLQMVKRIR